MPDLEEVFLRFGIPCLFEVGFADVGEDPGRVALRRREALEVL